MNDYYDVNFKNYGLEKLKDFKNFKFKKGNIADKNLIQELFKEYGLML